MRQRNAWVFDGDDTLWTNVHDYADSILDSCRLIIHTLGDVAPHVSGIVALEQEIDSRRVKELNPDTGKPFGYSMERFPGSLVEVYREICRRAGRSPLIEVERELYQIGLKAFDPARYKRNVYPHTLTILDFLQKKGDKILLLTKGDKRVQDEKLAVLNAYERFDRVQVVDDKNQDVFREMAAGFENHQLFSVGNNYDSDVVPALEVGYRGVWIPVETWDVIGKLDEIRARVDRSRCIELRSLKELVERYDELTEVK